MREKLSALLTEYAVNDPQVVILSGDHGYALFDALQKAAPDQFINVGIAEQGMIGIAAGLARAGYRPIVYGLSSFVPIRVLEQIKLDLCISKLPVLVLGDGAGLVYSTLGSSHQCGEDVAALRPMPGISIYSPADAFELEACFRRAMDGAAGPSYLRIGKSDRKPVHTSLPTATGYSFTRKSGDAKAVLVGTGSMSSAAVALAGEFALDSISVMQIKPFPEKLAADLAAYEKVFVLEEHHRSGGLFSAVAEEIGLAPRTTRAAPRLYSVSLKDQFARFCGSHEYALSEHDLTNSQIGAFIRKNLSDLSM
jgi:transketolase